VFFPILLSSVWHYECQINGIFTVLVFHEMHNYKTQWKESVSTWLIQQKTRTI